MKTYNKEQLYKISEKCYRFSDLSFLCLNYRSDVMYEEYRFITNEQGKFFIDAPLSNDILTSYCSDIIETFLRKIRL